MRLPWWVQSPVYATLCLALILYGGARSRSSTSSSERARAGRDEPLRVGLVIGQLTTGGRRRAAAPALRRASIRDASPPIVYCLSAETEPYGRRLAGAPASRVRVIARRPARRACARCARALAADRVDVVHAWLFIANAYAWAASRGARLGADHLGAQLQALRAACSTRSTGAPFAPATRSS